MDESRARLAVRRMTQQPVVAPPEAPGEPVKAQEPIKSCATCGIYPCGLWKELPAATILRTGQPFNFDVSQMPMLCAGEYWTPRLQSAWEKSRRQAGPTGLSQFTKRNEEDQ